MKTPAYCNLPITEVGGDEYLHLGVRNALFKCLSSTPINMHPDTLLQLDFSTDVASLNKVGKILMWPIQIRIVNILNSSPYIVGVFKGSRKPTSTLKFFQPFKEMQELHDNRLDFQNKNVVVRSRCFVADAHLLVLFLWVIADIILVLLVQDAGHFLLLHNAIRILVDPGHTIQSIDFAENCIKLLNETSSDVYGVEFLSYNVHALLHLPDDVRSFGPKPSQNLQQIANRNAEKCHMQSKVLVDPSRLKFIAKHVKDPTPPVDDYNYCEYTNSWDIAATTGSTAVEEAKYCNCIDQHHFAAKKSMLKMLKDMKKRNSPKARTRPACFPFKSIADRLEFNNSNEGRYDAVVNYLTYQGGVNLCDEVNFYFKNCFEFDADLIRNLSWLCSRIDDVKVSLMSTRFAHVCEAAMNLNKDALEKPTKDKFATAMTKAIKNAKEARVLNEPQDELNNRLQSNKDYGDPLPPRQLEPANNDEEDEDQYADEIEDQEEESDEEEGGENNEDEFEEKSQERLKKEEKHQNEDEENYWNGFIKNQEDECNNDDDDPLNCDLFAEP
ncbi:hypothetical protein TSAR_016362 [Trichomalopsis sarcophagae]|uniref:Uncharacterized protein n=1 Tax=Trichomalopsis sarcophagae TaxID=543379 RepID=A0A232ELC9_9HYME|nr:hypothetical protein TSAR_016362 [Trichomalopsis sarcophagae]